ncbi:uncharacterized protein LOC113216150 isoform X2 [Frankliniella occidentalis]|uniref:Uncharacterized protein LOC113216150 isoform X2 n=1 Tax=Frankliniella occidentalis TaxID=133901 RepID=A0A9C6XU68_FRAOC|nr:uncharacterized protein LOC113216150 isoform X2 [Frankliniella occidentalis]
MDSAPATIVMPGELDIFSPENLQNAILHQEKSLLKPISVISYPLTTLEFHSRATNDRYRRLDETFLDMEVCLRSEDGAAPIVEQDVACISNLLYSLFQTCEIYFNEKLVVRIDNFGYYSYINTLLSFSKQAADTFLQSAMFFPDSPAFFETAGENNKGFTHRKNLLSGGKPCHLFGKLRCGLFNQPLLIPQGIDLRVKLSFANENFYMWEADGATSLKLHVTDATLQLQNVAVSPSLLLSHARVFSQANAHFPHKRVETKCFTTPTGGRNIHLNSVCTGPIPSFICLAMIENSVFNGNRKKNSFTFLHKSATSISAFVNSHEYKIGPMDFHSTHPNFLKSYYQSLISATGADKRPSPHMITPEAYQHGCFLACFDTSIDGMGGPYSSIPNAGTTRLEINFSKPLDTSLTCLVLLEFDSVLTIDGSRNISIY